MDRIAIALKTKFSRSWCDAIDCRIQNIQCVFDDYFVFNARPTGNEKYGFFLDGGSAVVHANSAVVGGQQDQPVFCRIIGAIGQSRDDLCHVIIRRLNGSDVLSNFRAEAVSVSVDVHIVKMEK